MKKMIEILLFLVNLSICSSGNQLESSVKNNGGKVRPIELAAVGRVAKLGELYDARTDQFLGLSLINTILPNSSIISTRNRQTKLKYSMVNTLEEKFNTMNIQAELKLSIMFGLFDLEGSGKYFKDTKRSAKSAKASLISSFSTEYQQISITSKVVRELIDYDVLDLIDATHVVIGIQWGGNVFISVEDNNYEDQDQQKIEGNLNVELQMLVGEISGGASVNIDERQRNALNKFNFDLYGDLLPETTPQSLIEALVFMKSAPKILLDGNNGKGKAMKYRLLPMSLLRQIFKNKTEVNEVSNKIDQATVNSCIKLFDHMNSNEQKFNDILDQIRIYDKYISTKKSQQFQNSYQEFKVFQSELQMNLSEHLILVRSGHETIAQLKKVLTFVYTNPNYIIDFGRFSDLKKEIDFIKLMSKLNVFILDKETSMIKYLSSNFDKDIYIFFYKEEYPAFTDQPMMTFRNVLKKNQTFGTNAIFTAVKIDVLSETDKLAYFNFNSTTKLSMYRNGQKVIDNYELNTTVPSLNKPELWSFNYMQTQVVNLINQETQLKNELSNVKNNLVPIGYIHVQFPGQPEPKSLWPTCQWTNITPQYAGAFFRAEGGGSSPFGQDQLQQTKSLEFRTVNERHQIMQTGYREVTDNYGDYLWTGSSDDDDHNIGLAMKYNHKENRPYNFAIRIWRRTG